MWRRQQQVSLPRLDASSHQDADVPWSQHRAKARAAAPSVPSSPIQRPPHIRERSPAKKIIQPPPPRRQRSLSGRRDAVISTQRYASREALAKSDEIYSRRGGGTSRHCTHAHSASQHTLAPARTTWSETGADLERHNRETLIAPLVAAVF